MGRRPLVRLARGVAEPVAAAVRPREDRPLGVAAAYRPGGGVH